MSSQVPIRPFAALLAALSLTVLAAGQPANDNCATPTAINGTGTFNFSLVGATYGVEIIDNCGQGPVDIAHDVWFCWRATCTGLVTISTCGQTTTDTVLSMYAGCACPGTAGGGGLLCCDDNSCPPAPQSQSQLHCEVVCDQLYMIRIADKEFTGGPGTGSGTFTITCEGTPCGGGGTCPSGECCGGTPRFTGFTGPVSANTRLSLNPNDAVVQFVDMTNVGSAPVGSWWSTAPFYANPPAAWNRSNLGTVFGVAIDDLGNTYVAHSSVYATMAFGIGMPTADAVGFGGPGAIYKIATATGAVSVFASLPNTLDPTIAAQFPTEAYPGIGNISIDCGSGNLYASNFDDGRIYRIPLTGIPSNSSAYDHATDTIMPGINPEPNDPPGFVALGERVWAVQPHNGRLYYSIWGSDTFRSTAPNTMWSIQLNANGDFVAGTRRQETLPASPAGCPNPYTDISFSPSGAMLVAERSMGDTDPSLADTRGWAHQSCLLEYVCDPATPGRWNASPNTFDIGYAQPTDNTPPSAAGGVDVDFQTGGRVWATGDALFVNQFTPFWLYGLQGIPATGNTDPTLSVLIDLDNDVLTHDKTAQGSVEISCTPACADIVDGRILCEIGSDGTPTGCFTYTFSLTNNSGHPVQYVLIPSANVSPNVIGPFSPPMGDGETRTFTVRICDVPGGTLFTLPVILMNTEFDECCTTEHPVLLPECECLQILDGPRVIGSGPNGLNFQFTYQPLDFSVGTVFISYEPGNIVYNVTITPSFYFVNTPQYGTGTVNFSVSSNAPAGTQLCFRILIHTEDWVTCCSQVVCITWPGNGVIVCPGDLNGNGAVDLADLALLLSNFGTGAGATYGEGDIDSDGDVDLSDLTLLLSAFGTVCP